MSINSLEIKDKTNYDLDNLCYIDDFNVNSLKITKKNHVLIKELVLIFIILDVLLI